MDKYDMGTKLGYVVRAMTPAGSTLRRSRLRLRCESCRSQRRHGACRSGGFATVWLARRKSDGKTLAVKKIEVRTPWQFPGTATAGEVPDPPWACLMRRALCVRRVLYAQCENFDDANQALTEGKMLLELGESACRSAQREHMSSATASTARSLSPLPKSSQVHCMSRTLAAAMCARTRVICVSIYLCVCVFLCVPVCVCM